MKCSGDNPVDPPENEGDACDEYAAPEKLVNGLWATILAIGTVSTSMLIVTARSWRFFKVSTSMAQLCTGHRLHC